MNISQNIQEIIKQKKHTQKELAEYLNIATSTINNWIKLNRSIPAEHIIPICEFLGVSPYYLLSGEEKKPSLLEDEQKLIDQYNRLPPLEKVKLVARAEAIADVYEEQVEVPKPNIISINCSQNRVSAGIGEELFDYEQWDMVDVIETPMSRKADFMLIVDGESMSPEFHDGDYVLVRQQPAVEIGQIGIFYVDGRGYIKKYDGDYLISINPEYDDINLEGKDARCFGLVLGIAELAE